MYLIYLAHPVRPLPGSTETDAEPAGIARRALETMAQAEDAADKTDVESGL